MSRSEKNNIKIELLFCFDSNVTFTEVFMEIPALNNPVWVNIVLGKVQPTFGFLATKIFLGRVKMSLSFDSSQQNVNKLAAELRELFVKNISIPNLQKDLELILK